MIQLQAYFFHYLIECDKLHLSVILHIQYKNTSEFRRKKTPSLSNLHITSINHSIVYNLDAEYIAVVIQ